MSKEQEISQIKFSSGGRAFLEFLEESLEGRREALESPSSDPNDLGLINRRLGYIQCLRGVIELLHGEFDEGTEEQE